MKYCFLINNALFLSEFSGKLAGEMIKRGDDCLVILGGKITEYEKKKFFPDKTRFISAVDWRINNPKGGKEDFFGLSWKDFFPNFDRCGALKPDYNKSIEITLQTVQFFEFIFEKEKPDVVISEVPTGLLHLVAYYFCQKNNAIYLGLVGSRLNNRIDVYNTEFTCSKYEKTFKEINNDSILKEEKEFARNFMEKFISHEQEPSYLSPAKIYFSQIGLIRHFLKRIKEVYAPLLRYILSRKKYKNFDGESEIILKSSLKAIFRAERKKIRIFFQKRFFKEHSEKDKFFLFPIQSQPEASTDVYAIYYCDQVNTVKNIAFSLPFPYKLYVKEHPMAVGTKPKEFYEKLENIPNVVLVSPSENVGKLVGNSSGVITLTSTIGMEAALIGKPAYVLGDVFYSYHPLCRKVGGFEELKDKIKNDLINKPDIGNLQDINNRFITSYHRNTIPGDILAAGLGKDTNDYGLIYESILKILSQKTNFIGLKIFMSNKKIIFFLPTLSTGGGERVASLLSLNLPDSVKTLIVLFKNQVSYPYKGKLICLNIPISVNFFLKIYYFFAGISRLKKVIKKENPDYVISFGLPANIINVLSGKKAIVRIDTFLSSSCSGLYKILAKLLFKKALKIICVSKKSAEDLAENFGVKADKIKVIYNPLNIKEIEGLAPEPLESKYQKIFENPVIINMGRLTKEKNQHHLIKVFKEVKKVIKQAQLVILGTGELRAELEKTIKNLGLENNVHLLGWQENPFKFLAKSKVFVSISSREGLPYAVLEAMACGLPIISTDCEAGPREILAPETDINQKVKDIEYAQYGILIPVFIMEKCKVDDLSTKSRESLKQAMIEILTNKKMADSLAEKSKQRARDFDTPKIIKAWEFLGQDD